jgi:hypothetical protein
MYFQRLAENFVEKACFVFEIFSFEHDEVDEVEVHVFRAVAYSASVFLAL